MGTCELGQRFSVPVRWGGCRAHYANESEKGPRRPWWGEGWTRNLPKAQGKLVAEPRCTSFLSCLLKMQPGGGSGYMSLSPQGLGVSNTGRGKKPQRSTYRESRCFCKNKFKSRTCDGVTHHGCEDVIGNSLRSHTKSVSDSKRGREWRDLDDLE
jgi:hypothetical protein